MLRLSTLAIALLAACETATKSPSVDSSAGNTPPVVANGHDWIRFNVDEGRSGVYSASTGIIADSHASMKRQEVALDTDRQQRRGRRQRCRRSGRGHAGGPDGVVE